MTTNTTYAKKIRLRALETIRHRGFGHIGGAMSIVETLAALYNPDSRAALRIDPQNPALPGRDRLVLSKGHAAAALYAALSLRGFFPAEDLKTLNEPGTKFPSHCDMTKTPGVDMTTGSLGQGASLAVGLALGARMQGLDAKTFLILGDGECNEGQVWEALMLAAHQKLSNLIVFCDWNKQQLDGYCKDVLELGDLAAKFAAFGLHTQTVNGNDADAVEAAVLNAYDQKETPSMILLDTIKGYGVDFISGKAGNHHIAFAKDDTQIDNIIAMLQKEETV